MAELNEEQLKRAETRGRKMLETEPRAVAAHYDAGAGRVMIDLANGCAYAFPAASRSGPSRRERRRSGQGRSRRPELICAGRRWASTSSPRAGQRRFWNRAWMARELARLAGRTRSAMKAAAARSNGAKGGGRARRRRADGRWLATTGANPAGQGAQSFSLRSESRRLGEIDPEPVAAALVAAGHFGRGVAELLLDVALVDLGRGGEAGAQRMAGELLSRSRSVRSPRTPAAIAVA